ncbi:hypothetical protein E2C01_027207 [Portunus trituberculatus]|uniref:Uncharacterized protein n=1 Tax=Portunus trituberculatus TaxID=210409 RepID=A0A5B7EHK5_PORTR|nr:hypothetical protein [Portunus trituberculatus]
MSTVVTRNNLISALCLALHSLLPSRPHFLPPLVCAVKSLPWTRINELQVSPRSPRSREAVCAFLGKHFVGGSNTCRDGVARTHNFDDKPSLIPFITCLAES